MPQQLLACAQHPSETENISIAAVGPASRPVDIACDAHGSAAKPADDPDEEAWEELESEQCSTVKPTEAEQERQTFETNTAEDVIAVDHSNQPTLLETFAAFQTKLSVLHEAAGRVISTQERMRTDTQNSVDKPAENNSVLAGGATVAAKEHCRTIVLETQELIKKLTKPELKKMTDQLAEQANACVSTAGAPLPMLTPEIWSG